MRSYDKSTDVRRGGVAEIIQRVFETYSLTFVKFTVALDYFTRETFLSTCHVFLKTSSDERSNFSDIFLSY